MILKRRFFANTSATPPGAQQSAPQPAQAQPNANPAANMTNGAGGITALDQMKLANSQNKTSIAQMNGVMKYQASQSRNALKSDSNAIQTMGLKLKAQAGSKRLSDASLTKNASFLKTAMVKPKPAPAVPMPKPRIKIG